MKLLVFAHVPPPHHGQSYMVKLMLDGFGGDCRRRQPGAVAGPYDIRCYHVDVRLSKRLQDVGDVRFGKFFLLLFYCAKAIWYRFRYGVKNFYYVPAPGKRAALYRDWLVMLLCRPFFKRTILHWHAAGLAKWLRTSTQMSVRSYTFNRMRDVDLSIVLSNYNRVDAEKLFPKNIQIINNGIPDPCPTFERDVLPKRKARLAARLKLLLGERLTPEERSQAGPQPQIVQVLYLSHCTREKGAFDAIRGVVLANRKLAEQQSPLSLRLTVTGNFITAADRKEFEEVMKDRAASACVQYVGFVGGQQKSALLKDADIFCFPTFYSNENQPVSLIEAMAYGLPVVTTRWRSLPELFPANYPGLVDVRTPEQIADRLLDLLTEDGETLRQMFLAKFTLDKYLSGLAVALRTFDRESASRVPEFRTT